MRFERFRSAVLIVPSLAVALLIVGGPVRADDDRPATPGERARVEAALEQAGYTGVHDVEVDDGEFEADATSPEGRSVDVELHRETFEILEVDDD